MLILIKGASLRERQNSFLNEVFAIVRSEEYRRIAMLNETSLEGSAMATNKKDASQFRSQQGGNVLILKLKIKMVYGVLFVRNPGIPGRPVLDSMGKKWY